MVQNPKPDDPVSQEAAATPGRWREQDALRMDPLPINQRAVKGGQGRGASLRPTTKQSPTQRKVQRRCQQSRTGFRRRRQRSGQELGLVHGGPQTVQSDFPNRTIRFLQLQDRRVLLCPVRLQHVIGVLQASRLARGVGSSG
jgi:hypothetical protein